MHVDRMLDPDLFADIAAHAARAEAAGYGGLGMPETRHDPFVSLALAARETDSIELSTSIAIAFGRTPMTLAMAANDLQTLTGGRFALGLGSQIKPHITNRYSMPWSHPAARMRELVRAIRAIWDSWANGTKLDFRGDFYTHTLMTPMFAPAPHEHGAPPIRVAAVGRLMTEVAGEVGDGILCHGFTTERYLREVTLPALARGAERGGRDVSELQICGAALVAVADTDRDLDTAITATRRQLAFYASTPAYRGVLDIHGWGDLQPDLNRLSKQGEWAAMGELIDDDMLDELAIVGRPDEVARGLDKRFGDLVERVTLGTPWVPSDEVLGAVVAELGNVRAGAAG